MPDPAGPGVPSEEEPPAARDAAGGVPAEIDAASLRTYVTPTDGDFGQVSQCRGASNKLAFGVRLCALRWRGHFLADTRDVPEALLQMLAPQLGLLPMPLGDYPQDDTTRAAHLERIRQHLGFVRRDRAQRQRLLAHPTTVARGPSVEVAARAARKSRSSISASAKSR